MTTQVIYGLVPSSTKAAAEAAISNYLLSANAPGAATFSVPLALITGGSTDINHPDAWGVLAPVNRPDLLTALPELVAAFPGAAYSLTDVASGFNRTAFAAWLATQGYAIMVPSGGV